MSDSKIDDGGFAFPTIGNSSCNSDGMTLRDWFAGQAMNAINCTWSDEETRVLFAKRCYAMADAMIAARKGGAA